MSPLFLLIPILLPMLGGWIILLRPKFTDRGRNIFAEVIACTTSILVFYLFAFVRRESVTIYSFIAGFSLDFRVDRLASLFAGMIAFMWPLALLYAYDYMKDIERRNSFFAFYLMTYGVTLGVAFSANLVTMYVFFEMLTLVTLPLVIHLQNKESLYAGRIYVAYCIAGASMAFIAVIMGTLDGRGDFIYGGNLAGEFSPILMRIIFLFGFFGFGTKSALFPMYKWLPTASVAPTPVTALLHAVAVVNTGVFAVMRLTWYAYGAELLAGSVIQAICVLTAAFSMLFASVMALKQRHFKRRLAYSTMSNLSYILFGVMLLTPAGYLAGLAHMLFHSVIKMSLFLCAGAFMHVTGKEYINEINGIGRRMPLTFTAYTLGALSLSGVPLFCGFVSKWHLLSAGVLAGRAVLTNHIANIAPLIGTAALILSAFLCAMYTLSISIRAFLPPIEVNSLLDAHSYHNDLSGIQEAHWEMLLPIGIFVLINILFGLCSDLPISFLEDIAHGIL